MAMPDLKIEKDVGGVPTYMAPFTDETYTANIDGGVSASVTVPPLARYAVIYMNNLNVRTTLGATVDAAGAGSFTKGGGTVARNGYRVKPGQIITAKNESAPGNGALVSVEFFDGEAP